MTDRFLRFSRIPRISYWTNRNINRVQFTHSSTMIGREGKSSIRNKLVWTINCDRGNTHFVIFGRDPERYSAMNALLLADVYVIYYVRLFKRVLENVKYRSWSTLTETRMMSRKFEKKIWLVLITDRISCFYIDIETGFTYGVRLHIFRLKWNHSYSIVPEHINNFLLVE